MYLQEVCITLQSSILLIKIGGGSGVIFGTVDGDYNVKGKFSAPFTP